MKSALLLSAALLSAAGARAADPPLNRELCRENPKLDRASFIAIATWDGKAAPTKMSFKFDHCAVSGRDKDRPMEVQRIYRAADGNGLCLTTQLGSLITSARLCPFSFTVYSGPGLWTAELGPFFTSDLLSGEIVDAGRLYENATLTIQSVKPVKASP